MKQTVSAVITKGDIAFVSYCPELGVTSQGRTKKSALANLKEAVELYLEDKDVQEMLKKKSIQKASITSIAVTT